MPEKSAGKKVSKKTMIQYDIVLSYMDKDNWYKSTDFLEVLDVKERRTKVLLRELVENGQLIDNGSTKGKRYKKV